MKRKILLLAVTVICMSILVGGTWAYNAADQKVHNVITSSAVDIEIEEWQETNMPSSGGEIDPDGTGGEIIPVTGKTWTEYPSTPIPVMPSTTVSKIATVKNHDATAYIRARYEVIITKDGQPFKNDDGSDLSADTIKKLVSLSNEGITAGTTLPQGVNIESGTWLSKDGDSEWLYYSVPVPTGKSTAPLFTKVAFSGPNIDNKYQDCKIEVKVYAQGVQYANNGASVTEAAGWSAGSVSGESGANSSQQTQPQQ